MYSQRQWYEHSGPVSPVDIELIARYDQSVAQKKIDCSSKSGHNKERGKIWEDLRVVRLLFLGLRAY